MEIFTGVDIIHISRIEKSLEKPEFLSRFFGEEEQKLYSTSGHPATFIAANFAAKEAFSKALGTGVRGFSLNEVETLRDSLGNPYFYFSGKARKIVEERELVFTVSLSHDGDIAIAFVVAYKGGFLNANCNC